MNNAKQIIQRQGTRGRGTGIGYEWIAVLLLLVSNVSYAGSGNCSADQSYVAREGDVEGVVQEPVQSPGLVPADEIAGDDDPASTLYECLANNPSCAVFYAIDTNPNVAQDAAMRLCFRYSSLCRPLGCHRLP